MIKRNIILGACMAFAVMAAAPVVIATPAEAGPATCGGQPWTVSAFLRGECTGAQTPYFPGNNFNDKIQDEEVNEDTGRTEATGETGTGDTGRAETGGGAATGENGRAL